MADPQPSNAPEFTVSDLSGAIKRTVEERFERVRVRGEISGYRGPHSSGHAYFSLKDQSARIDAVVWRSAFARLKFRPEEGIEVIATGRITTFPGKSSYQIVIDNLEPAGAGALMALLEERKKRLAAEGLFDRERKRPLPYMPRVIGVVTSPTGAVIRDIIHRIEDRFPRRVLLWPVRVQGETAPAEVSAAIAGFNALEACAPLPRPDVLIVARGGGSLEDLWSFNEESVVRAAAASTIPLIAAIGHETDWTLIDYVADRRAPTPTGAAEFAVPVRAELLAQTRACGGRLSGGLVRLLERRRSEFRSAARALPGADALLAAPRQRLDLCAARLPGALRALAHRREIALAQASRRLAAQSPQARLGRLRERVTGLEARLSAAFRARIAREAQGLTNARERLERTTERLPRAFERLIDQRRLHVGQQGSLLQSLGYRQVLARGFAIVRDEAGHPVRLAASVGPGAALTIGFSDGEVAAIAAGEAPERAGTKARRAPATTSIAKQGSLF